MHNNYALARHGHGSTKCRDMNYRPQGTVWRERTLRRPEDGGRTWSRGETTSSPVTAPEDVGGRGRLFGGPRTLGGRAETWRVAEDEDAWPEDFRRTRVGSGAPERTENFPERTVGA